VLNTKLRSHLDFSWKRDDEVG